MCRPNSTMSALRLFLGLLSVASTRASPQTMSCNKSYVSGGECFTRSIALPGFKSLALGCQTALIELVKMKGSGVQAVFLFMGGLSYKVKQIQCTHSIIVRPLTVHQLIEVF